MIKIKNTRDLGVQFKENKYQMIGQDGAYSFETKEGLMFYFGDTLIGERVPGESLWYPGGTAVGHRDMSGLGKIKLMINNCGLLVKDKNITDGIKDFNYIENLNGDLKTLIPLKEDEDPDWIRIWCLHGIEVDNKVYLFYIKVKTKDEGPFPVNFDLLGSGMAVSESGKWDFKRVYYNGSDLFWSGDQPHFAPVAFIEGEYIYMYGVIQREDRIQRSYLARVKKDSIEDLSAYEYFSDEKWVKNIDLVTPLFSGMPNEFSVSYNEYLGKYLAVHSLDLSGKIVARVADKPWGKWSEPFELFQVKTEDDEKLRYPRLIYAGKEHPYYSKENGKIIYITYIEFEEYYPHLIEVELE